MDIAQMLDQLSEFQAARDALRLEQNDMIIMVEERRKAKIALAIPPELRAELERIDQEAEAEREAVDAEMADKLSAADTNAAALEEQIKNAVIENGATVKGQFIMAVYSKGRESVDIALLRGYAAAHPEVLQFIKVSRPSVSIRTIGKG